jgi:YidC/Oxa1 family membrane protein insertase
MQKIAPRMKQIQTKYKSDPQKQQQMMMELYKSEGVNPLAGCWPLLVQLPVLFSVYYAVASHRELYDTSQFLWVGSALAAHSPVLFGVPIFAASLAHADLVLIVIYMISQYVSMRFTSMPSTDPAQAQQMKMMQIISPLMIGFFGLKANWPSAMVLYWLSYNVFRTGQQFYLLRRYHEPLSAIDSEHVITADVPDVPEPAKNAKKKVPAAGNGAAKTYKVKKKTKGA